MKNYQFAGMALLAAAALGGCSSIAESPKAGADVSSDRQAPSRASLEQLFDLQNFDKTLDDAFRQMPQAALAQSVNTAQGIPEDRRQAVNQVLQKYMNIISQEFNTPELRGELRRVSLEGAAKVYTQREVDALIRFYQTPEGRSVMEKMPQYMEAITVPMVQVMAPKTESVMKKHGPQMTREINQAICGKDRCAKAGRTKK
ncbi:DUF2059 domain-containing protein [Neisseria sp. CCUG12390]|uniref:DUF2059 domain-containing protein n=1 Tax=Neisseria sp. CCUG12390 TaxID=3392035 RepID=UPI003A0FEBE7